MELILYLAQLLLLAAVVALTTMCNQMPKALAVDLAAAVQDLQAAQTVVLATLQAQAQAKEIMVGHLTMTMAVAVAVQVLLATMVYPVVLLAQEVLALLLL
jgi:hypothetical protein